MTDKQTGNENFSPRNAAWFFCLLWIIATSPVHAATGGAEDLLQGLQFAPCEIGGPGAQPRVKAECGTLKVTEDRASKNGRRIDLHVAIVRARSDRPLPDPLFFLAGGPGQAASEAYPALAVAFHHVTRKRDIVLVDQRGTGNSNALDCPAPEDQAVSGLSGQRLIRWVEACRARLSADPAFYTTAASVEDMEEVRRTLAYRQINIYGISYGTRLALNYLRRYPDSVRSAILDGVVPWDFAIGDSAAQDAQRVLDQMFDRCGADIICAKHFPDLPQQLGVLLKRLDEVPAKLTIAHPRTMKPVAVTLTRTGFSETLRLMSYTAEHAALIPLLISQARRTNRFEKLAAQSLIVGDRLAEQISFGAYFSIVCAEDVPFYSPLGEVEKHSYVGSSVKSQLQTICRHWPVQRLPEERRWTADIQAPVLLLSGDMDPITPPYHAERIMGHLAAAVHVIAPFQGHNVVFRGCVPNLVTKFVEQGSMKGIDIDCVKGSLRPFPFFTTFSGPAP